MKYYLSTHLTYLEITQSVGLLKVGRHKEDTLIQVDNQRVLELEISLDVLDLNWEELEDKVLEPEQGHGLLDFEKLEVQGTEVVVKVQELLVLVKYLWAFQELVRYILICCLSYNIITCHNQDCAAEKESNCQLLSHNQLLLSNFLYWAMWEVTLNGFKLPKGSHILRFIITKLISSLLTLFIGVFTWNLSQSKIL